MIVWNIRKQGACGLGFFEHCLGRSSRVLSGIQFGKNSQILGRK
jgi:hypothetical protein